MRLERVDADLLEGVQIPARLGPQRLDMTGVAPALSTQRVAPRSAAAGSKSIPGCGAGAGSAS
jgi:hypothetical protein